MIHLDESREVFKVPNLFQIIFYKYNRIKYIFPYHSATKFSYIIIKGNNRVIFIKTCQFNV